MSVARIKKRADFVAVQSGGRSKAVSAFVMLVIPGGSLLTVGYTASKKMGNAVERNRARRRLRAAVDAVVKTSPPLPSGRVVLIARRSLLTVPFRQIIITLQTHLPDLLR